MQLKQYYNPVRMVFGGDVLMTLPNEVKKFGTRCLLVIQDNNEAMLNIKATIEQSLSSANISFDTFCDIRPNPLIQDIEKGVHLINNNQYDVIIAVGGGSVIDTAKILSVSNQYEINWDMVFECQGIPSNEHKLPLISIPTTAGTGSHCTQAAILSDENNKKHSVYSYDFFSTVALVDYTLTESLPKALTASTGFDAFCHLSESYIMGNLSPIMEVINLDAMKKAIEVLPNLMIENKKEDRETMSIVDSCAGMCLSNGGAIIPHAFGEVISSNVYRINHGCSLAICYPPFVEYFYHHPQYGSKIKEVITLLNQSEDIIQDGKEARVVLENFLKKLQISDKLCDYQVTKEELSNIKEALNQQKRFKKEEVSVIIDDICRNALGKE